MNREIKFRVFDGTKMEHNVMAGYLGGFYVPGIDKNDSACMSNMNSRYPENTQVMQFTGLKDKNGKEIYEGDMIELIYRCTTYYPDSEDEDDHEVISNHEVIFNSGAWYLKGQGVLSSYHDHNRHTISVIGNILESPELINKQLK